MLRVKQGDSLIALLGNACLSIRFVTITIRTSQAEVMGFGFTPRAPRDNVIDFKNGDTERFGGLTIGAAMSELGSDLTPQGSGNVRPVDRPYETGQRVQERFAPTPGVLRHLTLARDLDLLRTVGLADNSHPSPARHQSAHPVHW